jgi:2-polyprenyl-3-methyl-5-hydroxy-6-metoxy-1,4-benzoquinol methylase
VLRRLAATIEAEWNPARELDELQAYLGDGYDHERLTAHVDGVLREEAQAPDELTFYRTSEANLYDLTVFAMSPTKVPYHAVLRRLIPPGASLLDYGCGIGSDGLRLLEAGYRVTFADFDNPSTRYLRWRLRRRGLAADIADVDDVVPGGFDAVYSFDVIEHTADPLAFLTILEAKARWVVVNFLEPIPDDIHVHKPLPVSSLVDHAARHPLGHYRRYHRRSHLVAYASRPARPVEAAEARARRAMGTARRRAEDAVERGLVVTRRLARRASRAGG